MPADVLGAPGGIVDENLGADVGRLSWEQAVATHDVRKAARGKHVVSSLVFCCSFAGVLQGSKADEVADVYEK